MCKKKYSLVGKEAYIGLMKQKIKSLVKEYLGPKVIIAAIVGALFSWGILWVLPSNKVDVRNLPQKELTCTLDVSYQMMIRKSSDNRFQIMYDGKEVKNPYAYNITILNSGKYSISNDDFKQPFTIDFIGCNGIINAQIVGSTNAMVWEEVLSKSEFDGNILTISDFFLNPNESFTMYIIADGQPDIIRYGSRIADVDGLIIRNTRQEKIDQLRQKGLWIFGILLAFILCFALYTFIVYRHMDRKNKHLDELYQKYMDSLNIVKNDTHKSD